MEPAGVAAMNQPPVVTTKSPIEAILGFWNAAESLYEQMFTQLAPELSDKVTQRVESFPSSEGHSIKVGGRGRWHYHKHSCNRIGS